MPRHVIDDAARQVIKAWVDEGPMPEWHRREKARVAAQWPTLAIAIEQLRRVIDDPYLAEEMVPWMTAVRNDVLPKIKESAITMVVDPRGEPDIKIAVELGLSILLGKPIIVVKDPSRAANEGLARIADEVIDGDLQNPTETARQLHDALDRMGVGRENDDG